MSILTVWWDQYTPRVEAQIIRDLLTLLTYGEVSVNLQNNERPDTLVFALETLGVAQTTTQGSESKAYLTLPDSVVPDSLVEPIVQQLFMEDSKTVLTQPGTPLVVDPPYLVPAPPQLSPNRMVEPPRTRNTILSPWLTN